LPKLTRKNGASPIRFVDILARRRSNLKKYLADVGITTYAGLVEKCERIGAVPPDYELFSEAIGKTKVNSPTEGVVVVASDGFEETASYVSEKNQSSYQHEDKNSLSSQAESEKRSTKRKKQELLS